MPAIASDPLASAIHELFTRGVIAPTSASDSLRGLRGPMPAANSRPASHSTDESARSRPKRKPSLRSVETAPRTIARPPLPVASGFGAGADAGAEDEAGAPALHVIAAITVFGPIGSVVRPSASGFTGT